MGTAFGAGQGAISTRFRLEPFIVTLAGLQAARGLALVVSDNQYINISYGDGPGLAPPVFAVLGERLFNNTVPVATIVFVVFAAIATVVLNTTRFGRYVFAVGGNERAAQLSGVPVSLVKTSVYAITGFASALAGIVHAGQFNFGSANDGTGYELTAIAAVVIGGTSLFGGSGSMVGTVAGTIMLGRARQRPAAEQHHPSPAAARNRRDHRAGGGASVPRSPPRGSVTLTKRLGEDRTLAGAHRRNVMNTMPTLEPQPDDRAAGRRCPRPRRGGSGGSDLAVLQGQDGEFLIGFCQANNAEPYRQHVNDELTAAAKTVPQFTLQIADGAGNVNTQTSPGR